jgi:hypothetical protein
VRKTPQPQRYQVGHVARYHREVMHLGDGRDHRFFVEGFGLAVHQLGPIAKGRAIHGEDVERITHLIQPQRDLSRLSRILFAGELNPRLDLTDGHTGEMKISIVDALEPLTILQG